MHDHALIFIQDLAIIMLVSGLITIICHQFRQPIVFGYLLAGILIGPHTPPFGFISDMEIIKTLAELGVIFLLFSLGLEFNLQRLTQVGVTSFIAAFAEILLMMWIGYEIGLFFGWSELTSIFLGAILSISSTTIIVKALDELGLKQKSFAQLIFGILIIEDVFAILIIAVLSAIAISGTVHFKEIAYTALKLSTFLVISIFAGILVIPRLISYIAKFRNNEMLLIAVLGLCFGFCLLVIKLKYSVALGAFIIGAVIAESKYHMLIETLINPIRDMFSAIFFVSVGLLFDPTVFTQYLIPIIVIIIAVVVGKIVTCSLGVLISGRDAKTALRVGMGLAQIGEFSFIIAAMGIEMKVTGNFLYSIAVAVSIITTITTPYLIKYSYRVTNTTKNFMPGYVVHAYKSYSHFLQHLGPAKEHDKIADHLKATLLRVLLYVFILIGMFLCAAYLGTSEFGDELINVSSEALQQTIIWTATVIISLPLLLGLHQQIGKISRNLIKISEEHNIHLHKNVKRLITGPTPLILVIGLMLLVSGLSANILPPFGILIVILFIVAIIIVLSSSFFLRIHEQVSKHIAKSIKKNKK